MIYLDEEHKNEVWNKHEKSVTNLAKKILKDACSGRGLVAEDSEDWLQELLLVAFKSLNKWNPNGEADFPTYAFGAMKFQTKNLERKHERGRKKNLVTVLHKAGIRPKDIEI